MSELTSKRSGEWRLILIVVGIIAVLSIGFFLLFNWADNKSPWFFRVLVVLLATTFGYRIGRAIGNEKTRPRWLPFGVALLGAAVALYFGAIRPAIKDHERDKAFASLMADGRTTADHLESIARDMPDPTRKAPITREHRDRNVEALENGIAWMKRYQGDFDRFTTEQRSELRELFERIVEASKGAREKLAVVTRDDTFQLLFTEGRMTIAELEAAIRDNPKQETNKSFPPESRVRIVRALARGIAWTKRYEEELSRFTDEQRAELKTLAERILEVSKTAREKLAEHPAKEK